MPYTRSGETTIHYEVTGNPLKPWLVLSNSLGTDIGFWDDQVGVLESDFRILRYDTRGHGGSGAPEGDYTFEQLGGDVLAVMDAAGADTARFCGLSMGGTTGLWLAINAPQRFEQLVLCNTGAKIGDASVWQPRIDAVKSDGIAPIVEGVVERWFTEGFRQAEPKTVDRIRAMILRTSPAGYAGCCAALRDTDLRAGMQAIRLPTLVVAGAHDPATPPALSEEIRAAIPGSRMVTLPAAHLSNIEARAEFNDAVSDFLKG
ncbi:3-oxoadipate enol-lactonase [Microbaculum marinum]|uniref:3-oxoadipate enol-lactonase n=1 Tax=Microbaculum marinum TaxID=1764581 RepID=A0AAW9RYU3_9HYPH